MSSERCVGTVVRGIRAPIIREGCDLPNIIVDSVLKAKDSEKFELHDKDVIGITESIVARSQGNYATIDQVAADIKAKFPSGEFGIIFPILSRNRFSIILKGILKGAKKVYVMLSYPSDEVGNELVSLDQIDAKGVNPFSDVLTEAKFRELFGESRHPFTGVDYIQFYQDISKEIGTPVEVILANDARSILKYTKNVLCCDIHSRERSQRLLKAAGAEIVYKLTDICSQSVNGSGFSEFGLLGSNKATEDKLKLFPRDCDTFVRKVQAILKEKTGKTIEVMVYGDGAFKDPVGKIWELADPIVSPGFTDGLRGQPNELKLKYLADTQFAHLSGEELKSAITKTIQEKSEQTQTEMNRMGTTPRQLTDLIGSLCDLTSGSGDKGTPIILIQGYFDNYSN